MRSEKKRVDGILFIVSVGLFALTLVYIFTIWNLSFHSDSAAANILAREQMRTGQFFPKTWNTSSGVFIFFYNILIIPLSLFTHNQILLRNLAVAIIVIVLVLLLYFLSKKIIGSNFYLVALCFLFSNTSSMVMDMAFAQAAYLISIVESMVLLIMLLKTFDAEFTIKSKYWLSMLLFWVAYLALYGVLNLAYQVLPLIGSIVLYFVLEHRSKPFVSVKGNLINGIKAVTMLISAVIIGLAGYKGIVTYTGFQSRTNIVYPDNSELANRFIQFLLNAIGYRVNVTLFSLPGLMNVVVLFANVSAVICCVLLFSKYQEQPFAVKVFMNFGLIIIAIHIYLDFVAYCLYAGNERYLFRPLIFMWFLAAYYIYTYVLSQGFIVKVAAIMAIVAFSTPYMLSSLPQVAHYSESRSSQLGLVNFLRDHDLKHGYATFWNAGNNMVLSDFDIEIGGVTLGDNISPFYWLSSTTSYDPDSYNGESFLMLTDEENNTYSNSVGMQVLGEPQEILLYDGYVIYRYPYNISENKFKGKGFQNFEFIKSMAVSDLTMRQENGAISFVGGQIVYGPYIQLLAGEYEIDLEFAELTDTATVRLTSGAGVHTWMEDVLHESTEKIIFTAPEDLENFEIVLTTGQSAVIKSIKISQIG